MAPESRYCTRCRGRLLLRQVEGHERPVCPACGLIVYLVPKLVAAGIVERDGHILLVRQDTNPGVGLWALPGGYVEQSEAVERAVRRELEEETGLSVRVSGLAAVYSEPGNPVILVAYATEPFGGELRKAGTEVQELAFFSPEVLPALAFSRDRKVLQDWGRLRQKGLL
ncbi:MAG: NUDIX hydrolase [Chloroflexi bacterium]|nr:NUDIX hydrolase [Chloroflexota bacterium]